MIIMLGVINMVKDVTMVMSKNIVMENLNHTIINKDINMEADVTMEDRDMDICLRNKKESLLKYLH